MLLQSLILFFVVVFGAVEDPPKVPEEPVVIESIDVERTPDITAP